MVEHLWPSNVGRDGGEHYQEEDEQQTTFFFQDERGATKWNAGFTSSSPSKTSSHISKTDEAQQRDQRGSRDSRGSGAALDAAAGQIDDVEAGDCIKIR